MAKKKLREDIINDSNGIRFVGNQKTAKEIADSIINDTSNNIGFKTEYSTQAQDIANSIINGTEIPIPKQTVQQPQIGEKNKKENNSFSFSIDKPIKNAQNTLEETQNQIKQGNTDLQKYKEQYETKKSNEQTKEEDKYSLLNNLGYVGESTGAGIVSGATGIVDAPLQYIQEGAEKGKGKSWIDNYLKPVLKSYIDPFGIGDTIKNIPNIAKDDSKSTLGKIGSVALDILDDNAITNALKITGQEMNLYDKNADKNVKKVREVIETPSNKLNEIVAEDSQGRGKGWQIAGQVGQTVGNMAQSIATSIITGNPDLALTTMGISVKGQATKEAEDRGANLHEANTIGYAKGLTEP